jgi:hypothetical protein
VVVMVDVEFMSPTVTDRIHFFVISNAQVVARLGEEERVEGKEDLTKSMIDEGSYSIGIYHDTKRDERRVGMIIPNKDMREKYFKVALISFFAGIMWMIIIGITLVGWTIASMLASFGFVWLLAIMEPIAPLIIPIFILSTAIVVIPIFTIIVYFPYVNRNLAREGTTRLKTLIQEDAPAASFHEMKVESKKLGLAIRGRLPDEFTMKVEECLGELGIPEGINRVSYTLVDIP